MLDKQKELRVYNRLETLAVADNRWKLFTEELKRNKVINSRLYEHVVDISFAAIVEPQSEGAILDKLNAIMWVSGTAIKVTTKI